MKTTATRMNAAAGGGGGRRTEADEGRTGSGAREAEDEWSSSFRKDLDLGYAGRS